MLDYSESWLFYFFVECVVLVEFYVLVGVTHFT